VKSLPQPKFVAAADDDMTTVHVDGIVEDTHAVTTLLLRVLQEMEALLYGWVDAHASPEHLRSVVYTRGDVMTQLQDAMMRMHNLESQVRGLHARVLQHPSTAQRITPAAAAAAAAGANGLTELAALYSNTAKRMISATGGNTHPRLYGYALPDVLAYYNRVLPAAERAAALAGNVVQPDDAEENAFVDAMQEYTWQKATLVPGEPTPAVDQAWVDANRAMLDEQQERTAKRARMLYREAWLALHSARRMLLRMIVEVQQAAAAGTPMRFANADDIFHLRNDATSRFAFVPKDIVTALEPYVRRPPPPYAAISKIKPAIAGRGKKGGVKKHTPHHAEYSLANIASLQRIQRRYLVGRVRVMSETHYMLVWRDIAVMTRADDGTPECTQLITAASMALPLELDAALVAAKPLYFVDAMMTRSGQIAALLIGYGDDDGATIEPRVVLLSTSGEFISSFVPRALLAAYHVVTHDIRLAVDYTNDTVLLTMVNRGYTPLFRYDMAGTLLDTLKLNEYTRDYYGDMVRLTDFCVRQSGEIVIVSNGVRAVRNGTLIRLDSKRGYTPDASDSSADAKLSKPHPTAFVALDAEDNVVCVSRFDTKSIELLGAAEQKVVRRFKVADLDANEAILGVAVLGSGEFVLFTTQRLFFYR
jgi:hypothetical protein